MTGLPSIGQVCPQHLGQTVWVWKKFATDTAAPLMHLELALRALDCVRRSNTVPTDSTWKCTRVTENKTRSCDHELSFLHVDSQPFVLHALLPCLELCHSPDKYALKVILA